MLSTDIRDVTGRTVCEVSAHHYHLCPINDVARKEAMWCWSCSWLIGIPFDPFKRGHGEDVDIIEACAVFAETKSAIQVDVV